MRKYFKNFVLLSVCSLLILLLGSCKKNSFTFIDDEEYDFANYINFNQSKNLKYIDRGNRSTYNINCTLDNDKKELFATQLINFVNNTGSDLNDMSLHLYPDYYSEEGTYINKISNKIINNCYADIVIKNVKIKSKEVEFTQDKEILKFKLPNVLKKNEKLDIEIIFNLHMPSTIDRLSYNDDDYSFVYWYPIICYYDLKTNTWDEEPYHFNGESNYSYYNNYNVNITVPKDFVIVATGVEEEKLNNHEDFKTYSAKENNVKDFVFFASPLYECITKELDGIKINSYYFKGHKSAGKRSLNNVLNAMDFMNRAIGKYTFKEFDITETHIEYVAMEYPTIIQLGKYDDDYNFDDNNLEKYNINTKHNGGVKVKERKLLWSDEAVVHEMMHQWWFNMVGNNSFKEPFLDEALTVCWTGLYFEYTYGSINPQNICNYVSKRVYSEDLLPVNRAVNEFEYNSDYFTSIYNGGWVILEDVRKQIGDENFVKVFRNYFNKYRFTNSSVEKLLDEFENICGSEIRNYLSNALNSRDYDLNKLNPFIHKEIITTKNGYNITEPNMLEFKLLKGEEALQLTKIIKDTFDKISKKDIESSNHFKYKYDIIKRYNLYKRYIDLDKLKVDVFSIYDVVNSDIYGIYYTVYLKIEDGTNKIVTQFHFDKDKKIIN